MEYALIYSDRKSISIKVTDGNVTVKAPRGVSRKYIDGLVNKHRAWIEQTLIRERRRAETENEPDDEKIKAMKREAKVYFTEKCAHYANIMGVEYGTVKITGAKTRYGSCSAKGNICFSYRLMFFPDSVRDYVVVHELAHRIEMNHSPRFYAVIERFMPDYRERRKKLKGRD